MIYLYIWNTHTYTLTHTVAQLDRRWPELWCGRQGLFTQLRERREGRRWREWCRERRVGGPPYSLSLPSSLSLFKCPLLPTLPPPTPPFPSSPTPRDAHLLGIRGHTHSSLRECVFVYVDFWNGRTEQKRQTDRHACEVAVAPASQLNLCFFFSLTLTFLLFFITVVFSFYLSILVLSTKIILSVVLSLSDCLFPSFSSNLDSRSSVPLTPSFSPLSSTCLLWLWEKLELKSSNLAVNGVVLSKIVLYIKNDFLKKKNDLIVNKVLDSGGVLSQL